MKNKLCIYICNSLVPEVAHLLQTGDYPDVELKGFNAACTAKTFNEEDILKIIGNHISEFDKIIVIVSNCFRKATPGIQCPKNVEIIQFEQCLELLFNLPSLYHFVKQGNYIVTNGWLRNYKKHINEWGFNPKTAKNFFGESVKKIVLLETGLPGDYLPNLEALSEYMGQPYEVFPIGHSHLHKSLDALILNWRNENERNSLNESIANFSRLTSEHLLIFNHLKELVNITDQQTIVEKIGRLCDLLFAPAHVVYEYFNDNVVVETSTFKSNSIPPNPEQSFEIDIHFDNKLLGRFTIGNVMFPVYLPQYLSMAHVIGQMGGLAISNAQRFTELAKANQTITESETRFKALMKQSPSVIEIYDLNGLQRTVNKAYEELWGFPASHTINKFNILKSEEVIRTGLIDYVERAYKGESVTVPVYQFNPTGVTEARGLGRERWLSTRIYPLKDQSEQVQSIVVTHEDVTEQRIARIKLAQSNEKFRNLSRSATEMLELKSPEDIYSYITKSLHEQYPDTVILYQNVDHDKKTTSLVNVQGVSDKVIGWAKKISGFNFFEKNFELIPTHIAIYKTGKLHHFKKGLSDFVGSQFPKVAAKTIETILGINQIFTIGISKDEKIFAAIHFFNRGSTPLTDNEYIESFVIQAGIIIDRKLTEQKVALSEKRFRTIFEESPIGIALINSLNGRIIEVNLKFASIAGRTPDQMKSIDWMSITHPDDVQEDLDNMEKLNAGLISGFNMHKRYVQPNGQIIWINMAIAPVGTTPEGAPMHLCMIEDITELKKATEDIVQKNHTLNELNATKDKFFSIISHDLRGPLSSILSLSELLTDDTFNFTSGEIKTYARSMYQTAESTYKLLENLLEWSRLQRGTIPFNPAQINIGEFLNSCDHSIMEKARNKQIKLEMKFCEGLTVVADENMLRSIIRNLVSNAIKFTKTEGTIQLKITKTKQNETLFTIQDNGIGMPPEILNHLFSIEENVSRPGTENEPSSGLGLILCKEFVEKHGGKIWAENNSSRYSGMKGSTFYVTLPYQQTKLNRS